MPQVPRDAKLKWDDITDFSPGIISNTQFSSYGNPQPVPKGAAQRTNTFRCIALPTGGLGPLPAAVAVASSPPNIDTTNLVGSIWTSGFIAFGPVLTTGTASGYVDELHFAHEYIYNNAGTNQRRYRWQRIRLFESGSAWDVVYSLNSAATGVTQQYHGTSFDVTRMATASPYTAVGVPVIAATWRSIGTGGEQWVRTFPDPSSPTVLGTLALSTTISGLLVAHQGRVVVPTTTSQSHGNSANVSFNDPVNFTDPANSNTFPATLQNEVFAQEAPAGYGALRSVNAGELMLVKNKGGAVLVSGDLNSPTVSRLPSVMSAGNLVSRGANHINGFVYGSYKQGVWLWEGGNTSRKISDQLEDDFFMLNTSLIAQSYSFEEWGEWMACSNNWLWDSRSGGWWRLEDPSVTQFMWFSRGFVTDAMFAAPMSFTTPTSTNVGFMFQKNNQLATNWSWQSHPLPYTQNRFVELREVVIVAVGTGTFTITLTAFDGSTSTITINVNSSQPKMYRASAASKGYRITARIVADNGASTAPTLHSIAFGYDDSQLVAGG